MGIDLCQSGNYLRHTFHFKTIDRENPNNVKSNDKCIRTMIRETQKPSVIENFQNGSFVSVLHGFPIECIYKVPPTPNENLLF